jgi:peptidoglycan/LPS O-acetylase OafA/YrhL
MSREPVLDLLRFVAALAVVFVHIKPIEITGDLNKIVIVNWFLENGDLGVDVFFVISGYVILKSAEKYSLRDFVVARFIRIFPAMYLVSTLTFIYFYLTNIPKPSIQLLVESLTLTFSQNPNTAIPPQLWTLVYEFKFYFILALLILISPNILKNSIRILTLIAILQILVIVNTLEISKQISYFSYSFSIERPNTQWIGLLFSIGCIIRILSRKHIIGAYLLLASNYLLLFLLREYDGVSKIILLILPFLILKNFKIKNVFFKKVCYHLGLLSYPLYLIHFYFNLYIIEHANFINIRAEFLILISVLINILVSFFIAILYETPIQRFLKRIFLSKS